MRLPQAIRLEIRRIAAGDEALFDDPTEPLARRRASGSARWAARAALGALGGPADAALPRSSGRYPLWPEGFVGSLAHDGALAVAAVARKSEIAALGVDVEPAEPLPEDVVDIVLLASERAACAGEPELSRAVFAAKEAVYKAINPLDATPLEYEDIAVDLNACVARLRDGRALRLAWGRMGLTGSAAAGGPAVVPAKAGTQGPDDVGLPLGPRFRGDDRKGGLCFQPGERHDFPARFVVVAFAQPPAMRAARS